MRVPTVLLLSAYFVSACGDEPASVSAETDAGDVALEVVQVEPTAVITSECALCEGACSEDELTYETRSHLPNTIEYLNGPPAGGDHDRCWAQWGVYDEPLAARNWVHNLEHGGIVVLYNCPDGCSEEVAVLESWVESLGNTAILSPDPTLVTRFAVIAWEHRLLTECLDEDGFRDFYERRVDQAPESTTAMPSSACM
jgi:hypothetical protein